MGVLATDDFNRANGGLGANWTELEAQTFSIVSQTVPCTFGADAAAYYDAVVWPNDQYAQVVITALAGAAAQSGPGVILRAADTNNYYRIVVNQDGVIEVGKYASAVYGQLASLAATGFVSGDTLKVEIQGNTLRVYRNGIQVDGDITGDATLTAGSAGIGFSSGADGTIDNFEGGDFGAPAGDTLTRRYQIRRSRGTSW